MRDIKYRYSALYKAIADTPELGKFHRYPEEWPWMLYDQSAEIDKLKRECNALIAKKRPGAGTVYTVTDVHQAHLEEEDEDLRSAVKELKYKIREYSNDLCLAHAVAQLPDQSRVFAAHFADYKELFEDGVFGPTGESDTIYKEIPSHAHTCSMRELERQDVLTDYLINNIQSLTQFTRRWAFWRRTQDIEAPITPDRRSWIELATIRGMMNFVAGLYGPFLFSVSMAILSVIPSTKAKIAVAGCMGAVLSMSVQLLLENVKRGELVSITAGYYAVAGIFIGATSGGNIGL